MIRLAIAALLLAFIPALAEPPAPLADRATILSIEMRRGPAEGLAPFLAPVAHTLSRQYAIRALGRIGDRGTAPAMLAKLLQTEKTQLPLALWAAGIAQAESLAGPAPIELLADRDPRVVQETIRRFLTEREGEEVDAALESILDHEDPKVRHLAAAALGKHGTAAPLRTQFAKEKDLRVRDVLAVELARCGDETAWASIAEDPKRAEIEQVTRLLTQARVLLASPRKEAFAEHYEWLAPTSDRAPPAAVTVRVLWEIGKRDDPALEPFLRAIVLGDLATRNDHVLASALGVIAENRMYSVMSHGEKTRVRGLLVDVLNRFYPPSRMAQDVSEVNRAVAGSLGELSKDETCPAQLRRSCERLLRSFMSNGEPSPWVRLAARDSAIAIGLKDVPDEDALPANDWKGLPRPDQPVLGLDLSGEGEWLTEAEILLLADRIAEANPTVVIETTAGAIRLRLLPEHAPVHCASLVLSAVRGTYRDTRFHRVAPSFVIQGGDPHGHGAGDAGFTIPDEISPIRYRRGDLGMPKSRKDDGGCQLFLMHCAYPRLDERYTLYGRMTAGLDVVDRIRVGDRIRNLRLDE